MVLMPHLRSISGTVDRSGTEGQKTHASKRTVAWDHLPESEWKRDVYLDCRQQLPRGSMVDPAGGHAGGYACGCTEAGSLDGP
jgi:hypothetical protein